MSIRFAVQGYSTFDGIRDKSTRTMDPVSQFLNVDVKQEIRLTPDNRATGGQPLPVEVDDTAVLELTYSDGTVHWISAAQYKSDLEAFGTIESDRGLRLDPQTRSRSADRGIFGDLALQSIKILGLDLKETAADGSAKLIISKFETELTKPGLYQISDPTRLGPLAAPGNTQNPYLVLLHGTFSNTVGTFSKLANTPEWNQLTKTYGERLLAFDHYTLSKSPIENALDLAEVLPAGATLHLVSHSRGGLVGELLSLDPSQPIKPLLEALQVRSFDKDETARLGLLLDKLAEKRFSIDRFVRVACPSRGTILASRRLDEYLSAVASLLKLLPDSMPETILNFVTSVAMVTAQKRASTKEFPGLEAMMPESPFIAVLNSMAQSKGDLAVIAGDARGQGVFERLKTVLVDAFFRTDNDYVVNTDAMYQGAIRPTPITRYTDPDVTHFTYFEKPATRARVTAFLAADRPKETVGLTDGTDRSWLPGFVKNTIDGLRKDAPVVYLLPGIMGSKLKVGSSEIWINPIELALGGFEKLANLDRGQAFGLMNSFYGLFSSYLTIQGYEVREFPYDWRQPLESSAQLLAKELERALKDRGRRIYFAAHSMGGLVVRTMISERPELWQQVLDRSGRLLMLGTPNQGSYAVVTALCGRHDIVNLLSRVDIPASDQQIRDTIKGFPGLLDLLTDDLFDPKAWQDKPGVTIPEGKLLAEAKARREKIRSTVGPEGMVYVAGTGSTIKSWKSTDGKLEFVYDEFGDGTVTHAAGLLPKVPARYVNASHGSLVNLSSAFEGYLEFLVQGKTSLLSEKPIAASRGLAAQRGIAAPAESVAERKQTILYPTVDEMAAAALGATLGEETSETLEPIRVSVVHGNLKYAKKFVAVGHYQGDSIVSAEAALDQSLDGALKNRWELNLYPGAAGTTELVPNAKPNGPGALIIGLGEVGELSTDVVESGVQSAAYQLALHQRGRTKNGAEAPLKFASLLIGTGGGRNSLSIEESVKAILNGVSKADQMLRRKFKDHKGFVSIELIELFEDCALEAATALERVTTSLPSDAGAREFVMDPEYLKTYPGGRFRRPFDVHDGGWWRRVLISKQVDRRLANLNGEQLLALRDEARKTKDATVNGQFVAEVFQNGLSRQEAAGAYFEFLALTDRARAEQRSLNVQSSLIDQLVALALTSKGNDFEIGHSLYQLLLPYELRQKALHQHDLVIVVDPGSAQYPWELLAARSGAQKRHIARHIGLIRQFRAVQYRERPVMATQKSALVIGDPLNSYFQLPGALEESRRVRSQLREGGYEVEFVEQPNALAAINALYRNSYRVLHIAGHGIFDPQDPMRSGVILSNGTKLTAAEVEALDEVPQLVFLNCCFLGQLDPQQRERAQENFPQLAASIAEQLIRIGVKAIVAAGWAVDDSAAKTFAETFYAAMLRGQHFGKAVLEARQQTYNSHPQSNTWGAYQCYGDPDFALEETPASKAAWPDRVYSERQCIDHLRSLATQYADMPDNSERAPALLEWVDKRLATLPEKWKTGALYTVAGDFWRDAGEYEKAAAWYDLAVGSPTATAPAYAREQVANCLTRLARKNRGEEGTKYLAAARAKLANVPNAEEQAEPLCLLGAIEKVQAQFAENWTSAKEALKRAEEAYTKALGTYKATSRLQLYPGLNAAACRYLLGNQEATRKLLERLRPLIGTEDASGDSFWARLNPVDFRLIESLVGPEGVVAASAEIEKSYLDLLKLSPKERHWDSILGQLAFLCDLLQKVKSRSQEWKALQGIYDRLKAQVL